jgi:hypothetical protein
VDGILEGNKTWGGSWVVGCTNSHTHMSKKGVCATFACLSIILFPMPWNRCALQALI